MSRAILIARIAGVVALAFATGWALQRWTFVPLRCARAAFHGTRVVEAAERQGDVFMRRAARSVREDLRGCECAATHDLFFTLAGVSDRLGEPQFAMAQYRRALDFDRRPETYFELGLSAIDALDGPAAIENLTRACAFDPRLLANIPYEEIRRDTRRRLHDVYGDDWLR